MIGEKVARSENLQERGPATLGHEIHIAYHMVFNKYSKRFKYSITLVKCASPVPLQFNMCLKKTLRPYINIAVPVILQQAHE